MGLDRFLLAFGTNGWTAEKGWIRLALLDVYKGMH